MTDPQPQNTRRIAIPEYLWDVVGGFIGALVGGAAGAACGIALSIAIGDWTIVPVASLGGAVVGAVVGGLIGYFAGGSAYLAFDLYMRVKGARSRIPIVVGLLTGGLMLLRVLVDKDATWLVAAIGFAFFWLIGYATGCAGERIISLVKWLRERSQIRK